GLEALTVALDDSGHHPDGVAGAKLGQLAHALRTRLGEFTQIYGHGRPPCGLVSGSAPRSRAKEHSTNRPPLASRGAGVKPGSRDEGGARGRPLVALAANARYSARASGGSSARAAWAAARRAIGTR